MPKQPRITGVRRGGAIRARDTVLFALGALAGAVTLLAGGPLALAAPFLAAVVSGFADGRYSVRLRALFCWLPAWLGTLLAPAYMMARDIFRQPPAPDGGLAISVGLAGVGVASLVFIGLALTSSAVTRALTR